MLQRISEEEQRRGRDTDTQKPDVLSCGDVLRGDGGRATAVSQLQDQARSQGMRNVQKVRSVLMQSIRYKFQFILHVILTLEPHSDFEGYVWLIKITIKSSLVFFENEFKILDELRPKEILSMARWPATKALFSCISSPHTTQELHRKWSSQPGLSSILRFSDWQVLKGTNDLSFSCVKIFSNSIPFDYSSNLTHWSEVILKSVLMAEKRACKNELFWL